MRGDLLSGYVVLYAVRLTTAQKLGCSRTCFVLQTRKLLAFGVCDAAVGISKVFKHGNSSEQVFHFSL